MSPSDTLFLDLHGTLDGFAVTYCGQQVAEWPTLTGAARGLALAKQALVMLAETLAKKEVRS
jgi:hypothetical protein